MKLLIVSDSHGNLDNMVRAVEQEQPQMILHLGDGYRDAERLSARFPDIPLQQVSGNCDLRLGALPEQVLSIADRRVMLCHGHVYGVKQNLLSLRLAAEEQRADVVLFGHTHQPLYDRFGSLTMLNPGSIGDPLRPAYAVLFLRPDGVTADLLRLN